MLKLIAKYIIRIAETKKLIELDKRRFNQTKLMCDFQHCDGLCVVKTTEANTHLLRTLKKEYNNAITLDGKVKFFRLWDHMLVGINLTWKDILLFVCKYIAAELDYPELTVENYM